MPKSLRDTFRRMRWCVGPTLAALVAGALAGCGDDATSPGAFDPVATQAAAEDVSVVFANSEVLASLGVFSGFFPSFSGSAALLGASLPFDPIRVEAERTWIDGRLRLLRSEAMPFAHPIIAAVIFPADVLGTTFVYNPDTESYEPDPGRTGAPADGVRLVLYAVDPVLRQPVLPLNEIGHLDLRDQSTPAADILGITAVVNDVTVLDYQATATVTTTSFGFSAAGFLTDGTRRVDFDLSVSLSETEGIAVDYTVTGEGATIEFHLSGDAQSQAVSIEVGIMHGGNEVIFQMSITETSLSGSVTHNGQTVIEVSGTPDEPIFTDASGNELTPEQLEALRDIFESAGEVLERFDDLLEPAFRILQLPIGLEVL